jgi:hypothetical protein
VAGFRFEYAGRRYEQHRKTLGLVKALLFLWISGFGLLGIRLLPATASDGWIPVLALLAVLGLIAAALIEITRAE